MNIFANYDIMYYLSSKINRYPEQTVYEISTMLYLAELLSIYDGRLASEWGYNFAYNEYGAPVSSEIICEIKTLCSFGIVLQSEDGYYRINSTSNILQGSSKLSYLSWKTRYIDTAITSLLTKPFPKVVSAIQEEPGISSLTKRNKTSTLLTDRLSNVLFKDFNVLKEVIQDNDIDLIVPASIWIDYLISQKNQES